MNTLRLDRCVNMALVYPGELLIGPMKSRVRSGLPLNLNNPICGG
jgi:hypothetical protein